MDGAHHLTLERSSLRLWLWTRTAQHHTVRFAWGYGGQFIFVAPELQLVVVTTSDSETNRDGSHTWTLHRILADETIPAVLARPAASGI